MTARLRKLFAGASTSEGSFGGNYDEGCFAGEGKFDRLRGIVCDLSVDLIKGLEENLIKRSLSVIRGNTFGSDTLNKDTEVRDLKGA